MTNQEAIETIKANYPDERYTMLREALDLAIKALERQESESQREDEAASDMRDYCERYEPTYNPEDGSM